MAARGLKTKIAFNITIFLLLGMLSIDLVTMMTAQRNLIRAEMAKGKAVAKLLGDYLLVHPIWEDLPKQADARAHLGRTLAEAGVTCFFLLGRNQQQISFGASRCAPAEDILALVQRTLSSGLDSALFMGSTFGFFWMQHEYLVVTTPLRANGDLVAGFSLVFSLDAIYRSLRQSQQVLLVYILVNTAILAFVGIYRVFKLYLQPLARLAQRAEDYKEDDEVLFSVRKEDNELQRLSAALNGLLRRLSAEKEKLRATVASLEAANAELKKAQTEFIRAEKLASVGRLSAGIAHEIGNPIGIVTGYLELLKQDDLPADERTEYLDRAEQEIERISAIIRQLLEISRPSHGGPQRVSVHAIIGNMAQALNVQPFMSHVRLATNLGASRDDVMADANQLRQVFLNLIINAADAISAKGPGAEGQLIVTTDNSADTEPARESDRSWVHIHFSDNGSGIPQENLANIFDPFFTTKEPGKGTGLGLSVSFMIIESFGGSMRVESVAGQGTCMTVSLPAAG
jgi:signal transduction histidine kinase